MIPTQVLPDAYEIVSYDEPGIPLYIRQGTLSHYPDMRATCHWHEDLEFIHILDGEMGYFINGERIMLYPGDSLFVNARQMHYGYAPQQKECHFLCTLIHPSMLSAHSSLQQAYISPLISDSSYHYLVYNNDTKDGQQFGKSLIQVWKLKESEKYAYQLEAVGLLMALIAKIAKRHEAIIPTESTPENSSLNAQKQMVSYIASHYHEDISLTDLADCVSVSKSTCERLFKTYTGQTPLQFLNSYRLERTRSLLISTDMSITDIAASCGFNHTSYFGKLFERSYGSSPSAYRKKERTS